MCSLIIYIIYKSRRQLMLATLSLLRMIYHVDFALHNIWLHIFLVNENMQCVLLCDIYHMLCVLKKTSSIIEQVGFISVGEMVRLINEELGLLAFVWSCAGWFSSMIFIILKYHPWSQSVIKRIIDINPRNEIMLRRIIFWHV